MGLCIDKYIRGCVSSYKCYKNSDIKHPRELLYRNTHSMNLEAGAACSNSPLP